jgi:hypothetical protein
MRSQAERERVRELVASGLNDCEIARATGIPRGTVRDWRRGKLRHERAQTLCAGCAGTPERLPAASYAYLLGAYLGDGYIVHTRRGVYHLRVACDLMHINIAWWIALAIDDVRGRRGVLRPRPTSSVIDVSSHWKHWPCHPHKTYEYARYEFSNRSDEIKCIFCDACEALGVEWRVMNRKAISIARRDSVAKLDAFVGPKR